MLVNVSEPLRPASRCRTRWRQHKTGRRKSYWRCETTPRLRLITQRLLAEQWTVERLRAEIQRRPRVNRGYQPAVFEDRGDKGYRLVVRLQTIRPQDYPMIRGHLEKALSRLTEFEAGGQEDKNF